MDSFKDVLEAAQAYCKTQMAEPTYNLYIDGLEPISFEDSSHITLSVRNDFICKIVTDRYLGLLKELQDRAGLRRGHHAGGAQHAAA